MKSVRKLSVVGVGDIMLGDGIQNIRRGVRAAWAGKDSVEMLGHLKSVLSTDGLTIGNLESVLGEVDSCDPQKMIYTGSSDHLRGLKAAGFTHLVLANNHILQQGLTAAKQSQQWVERAEMVACCGRNPVRSICNDTVVDLFTYNLIDDMPHLNFYRDMVADEDLKAIKASDADVKIVNVHWGSEYCHYPSPSQIELGHQFVDHGASLVLGHHPHVVQGVEQYHDAIIAYSLGNFIFDMIWSERTRSAFILKVEIEAGKARLVSKVHCRLDQDFVPRIAPACGENESVDANVLRYWKAPVEYQKYSRQSLNRSRLQAIFYLLRCFYAVDMKTWEILIGRRFKRLTARQPAFTN